MSSFEDQAVEKVDITDVKLAGELCKNYKSLGRQLALWYLYQSDIADNGIPTDSNSAVSSEVMEGEIPDIILDGGEEKVVEEKTDTVYDLFWRQVGDSEVLKCSTETFKRAKRFADRLITGVREKQTELDAILANHSEKWDIQRMATVDRNIIRAAIYEMKYCPSTPPVVCITEAIKIGKIFGAENTKAFINGILNTVMKEIQPVQLSCGCQGGDASEAQDKDKKHGKD